MIWKIPKSLNLWFKSESNRNKCAKTALKRNWRKQHRLESGTRQKYTYSITIIYSIVTVIFFFFEISSFFKIMINSNQLKNIHIFSGVKNCDMTSHIFIIFHYSIIICQQVPWKGVSSVDRGVHWAIARVPSWATKWPCSRTLRWKPFRVPPAGAPRWLKAKATSTQMVNTCNCSNSINSTNLIWLSLRVQSTAWQRSECVCSSHRRTRKSGAPWLWEAITRCSCASAEAIYATANRRWQPSRPSCSCARLWAPRRIIWTAFNRFL